MAYREPDRRQFLPLDKHDTAFAVHQALGMRRFGHAQHIMDSALHGVVAELIADALAEAGYVVTIPQRPDPMDTLSFVPRNTRPSD
jgi:uncharacterized protein YcgL (UPF0745 family)